LSLVVGTRPSLLPLVRCSSTQNSTLIIHNFCFRRVVLAYQVPDGIASSNCGSDANGMQWNFLGVAAGVG
jgi:hypothetical protein